MRAENERSNGGASGVGKVALIKEAVETYGCVEKTQEMRECERKRGTESGRGGRGGLSMGIIRR